MEKKVIITKIVLLLLALVVGIGSVIWGFCLSPQATAILLSGGVLTNVLSYFANKCEIKPLGDKVQESVDKLNTELKNADSNDRVELVKDIPVFKTECNEIPESTETIAVDEQAKPKKKRGSRPKKKKV